MALTALVSQPQLHNPKELSWRDLLALNPEEVEDIVFDTLGRPVEHYDHDALQSYLGIKLVAPESLRLLQIAMNLVAEVEPTSLKEARL
eukprot:797353-Rhodomonas_salina.2